MHPSNLYLNPLELIESNQKKAQYLIRYEPLNDYFQAQKQKDRENNKNESDPQYLESMQFDLGKFQEYINKCKQYNLKALSCDDKLIYILQIAKAVTQGISLMIYGYGSKFQLLNDVANFISGHYSNFLIFVSKGFKLTFSIQQMLKLLKDTIYDYSKQVTSDDDQFSFLDCLQEKNLKLILMIHSLDGKKISNQESQDIIAKLSSHQSVVLLGSFDNYQYPLICKVQNTMYMNINTFSPYEQEIPPLFSTDIMKKNQQDGLLYVYKSLNANQKEIIGVLAKILTKKKLPNGPTLEELLEKCIKKAVLSNKQSLRENLKELLEHKVIILKNNRYQMPFNEKFVDEISKGNLNQIN